MGANLKEVRERIKSVMSTQQITKAMKMVSAAKLRRAQQAIVQMRPYADRLNQMLVNILSNLDGDSSTSFGVEREVKNALVVVVTSDRGLCGAFNSNVIKAAISAIEEKYSQNRKDGNLSIMCIGKRSYDFFKKRYKDCEIITEYTGMFADLSFENVSKAADYIMDSFEAGKYDSVHVAYGRFKNAAMQFPELVQYLPVKKLETTPASKKTKADYIFEPGKKQLLDSLVPSILQTSFQKFLLDTNASEHGARMTAMDKATENAQDLLGELRINYNKARQEAITKELSEIVGGAAALGG
jgi:F-type H+-transporting ATPase subunit gamma